MLYECGLVWWYGGSDWMFDIDGTLGCCSIVVRYGGQLVRNGGLLVVVRLGVI